MFPIHRGCREKQRQAIGHIPDSTFFLWFLEPGSQWAPGLGPNDYGHSIIIRFATICYGLLIPPSLLPS